MNLRDLSRDEVITVSPEDTVRTAVERMQRDNVGAVVVVRGKKVVGILTDRDVCLAVVAGQTSPDRPVSEIMTTSVVTIWEDQGVFNATQYFQGNQVRRLPIVNRDEELVGLVTLDDLVWHLSRELHNLAQAVQPALHGR